MANAASSALVWYEKGPVVSSWPMRWELLSMSFDEQQTQICTAT